MSDTPRTDKAVEHYYRADYQYVVSADFARQLERELALAKASEEAHWRTLRECADILCLPDESPSLLPEKIRLLQSCLIGEKGAKIERGDMLVEAQETIAAFVKRDTEITAKLGTETARLDALSERAAKEIIAFGPTVRGDEQWVCDRKQNYFGRTLREAIDEMRQPTTGS